MKRTICLLALVFTMSVAAVADIARPGKTPTRVEKPKPGVTTTMTIKLDREATEPRLMIPKSQVKQLRAELEQLDGDDTTAAVSATGISRTQTLASGLLLSLALAFGGIWFARSGKLTGGTGKALVVVAAIAATGAAATLVYANIGPPPGARSITSKLFDQQMFAPYGSATGKIKIETSDRNTVELIVPDPQTTPAGE